MTWFITIWKGKRKWTWKYNASVNNEQMVRGYLREFCSGGFFVTPAKGVKTTEFVSPAMITKATYRLRG